MTASGNLSIANLQRALDIMSEDVGAERIAAGRRDDAEAGDAGGFGWVAVAGVVIVEIAVEAVGPQVTEVGIATEQQRVAEEVAAVHARHGELVRDAVVEHVGQFVGRHADAREQVGPANVTDEERVAAMVIGEQRPAREGIVGGHAQPGA